VARLTWFKGAESPRAAKIHPRPAALLMRQDSGVDEIPTAPAAPCRAEAPQKQGHGRARAGLAGTSPAGIGRVARWPDLPLAFL